MAIRRILVEDKVGAITAFAVIGNQLYGLTAGHVLTGNNNHLDKNETVSVFDDVAGEWLGVGQSNAFQFTRGDENSIPGNFGTLDAGIFSLSPGFRNHISPALKLRQVHPAIMNGNFESLRGMRVFSYSVMYERMIAATIADVFSHSDPGNRYDLIIDSDDNEIITTGGDSGILWYDVKGFAVGMHTNGNAEESTASYTTLINRVNVAFQIQQLYVL